MPELVYLSRLPYITFPEPVNKALSLLEMAGYQAYVVGGAVRDLLRDVPVHDWDITTDADPQAILAVFDGFSTYETGIVHGTVTVMIEGMPLEITTFRTDGDYTDHRHPDHVIFTNDINEDLARRDFTINAMALTREKELIDPFEGVSDLAFNLIRAVGDPYRRFEEDALRIMRAFRFSAACLYKIEEETLAAAKEKKSLLRFVSKERIDSEWKKLLSAVFCSRTLVLFYESGVMKEIFPDIPVSIPFFESLELLPNEYEVRMAALLRDLSKEETEKVFSAICPSKKEKNTVFEIKEVCDLIREREKTDSNDESSLRVLNYRFGQNAFNGAYIARLDGNLRDGILTFVKKLGRDPERIRSRSELAVKGDELFSKFGIEARDISAVISVLLYEIITKHVENEKDKLLDLVPSILEKIQKDKALDPENWRKKEIYSLS